MSQHGIDVLGPNGAVIYSSTDVTWNQVDMLYCPGGQTTTETYGALAGKEKLATQTMINPPPLDRKAVAHTITFSGVNDTTVTVSGGSEDAYVMVLMR